MTITDVFFKVLKSFWPKQPRIREEALEGLKYAAKVMERFTEGGAC